MENTVIDDARVLTADYLPNRMVHRDNEREVIASNLRPILQDQPPIDMLIYGPPGTGKTAMAEYVVDELEKHSPEVLSGFVDGFGQPSRFEVYYKLLRDMNEFVTRGGTSTEELVDKFEEKAYKSPMVIVIDEVDQIKDEKVLYDLSRFQNAAIILIANRDDIFADMDDRIRSSFSSINEIRFKAYNDNEILDILKDRVEYGLRDNVIEDSVLKLIASKSGGDARVAISTLRKAAQQAEREGLEKIEREVVKESFSDAVKDNRSVSLQKLNEDQRKLYDILKEEKELKSRDLFEAYREKVEEGPTDRTLRRYMKKMEAYGLVEPKGSTRDRKYSLKQ
ncbi:MAG: orc1/cdc6 family replication initiation protein [Candidatus Nanohaloarchaea archaeon]